MKTAQFLSPKGDIMNTYLRRSLTAAAGFATSVLGFVLFSPSAFGIVTRPMGGGSSAGIAAVTSAAVHGTTSGGTAGWEIALIAVGASLATAALMAVALRSRQPQLTVSPA